MTIDISNPPDTDIFRDRKKNILWFVFFLIMACSGVGIGVFAVYFDTRLDNNLDNWSLAILVGSSLGITYFGNRLQGYKRLFPPQEEKLAELRKKHPNIERYCTEVQALKRRMIRAEYEACVDYAEKHSAIPFT